VLLDPFFSENGSPSTTTRWHTTKRSIRVLGLEVAARKTEVVICHGRSRGPSPPTLIRVGEARVLVGEKIKYLGLQLDATWSFGEHFRRLAPRVEEVAMALSRLLPNLGGSGGRVRRVYAAVVASVALYEAPVWAVDVAVPAGCEICCADSSGGWP